MEEARGSIPSAPLPFRRSDGLTRLVGETSARRWGPSLREEADRPALRFCRGTRSVASPGRLVRKSGTATRTTRPLHHRLGSFRVRKSHRSEVARDRERIAAYPVGTGPALEDTSHGSVLSEGGRRLVRSWAAGAVLRLLTGQTGG
jgi:hypothetical protein